MAAAGAVVEALLIAVLWLTALVLLLRHLLGGGLWQPGRRWTLGALVFLMVFLAGAVLWPALPERSREEDPAGFLALLTLSGGGLFLLAWDGYRERRREARRKDERMGSEKFRGYPALERARDFCHAHHMLPPPGGVMLCAVSGGRDSMALLFFMKFMAAEGGFFLRAAHYNHHLRPTAGRDEALVRRVCRDWEVPLTCGGGDVAAWAKDRGASLEDAARTLRYRFLEETADAVGAVRIATAHHVQDNAETVLLHLLRGSGLRGLSGIPPVRGRIVRPFLETDRREIDALVAREGIPYAEDESNSDTAYTRNRLRWEIFPLLEQASPGCTGRIAAAAGLLREEEAHLAAECHELLPPETEEENSIQLPAAVLGQQDAAMARRLVREMARRLGGELTAQQTQAVLSLGSGGVLDLPGGLQAFRRPHRLTLRRLPPVPEPLILHEGEQAWNGGLVCVAAAPPEGPDKTEREAGGPGGSSVSCILAADRFVPPLTIGPWDGTGRLGVENGNRTVKRLFADRGIPVQRREEHPALYDGTGRLLAVLGVAVDWQVRPREGERSLCIVWEKEACHGKLL